MLLSRKQIENISACENISRWIGKKSANLYSLLSCGARIYIHIIQLANGSEKILLETLRWQDAPARENSIWGRKLSQSEVPDTEAGKLLDS